MSDKKFNVFSTILISILVLFFLCCIIINACDEVHIKKQYGETRYEFVITDMYDDLGSNWHLIGGRATEQEYHVIYKYRVTNRPGQGNKWYISETTVNGGRYRKLHVGQTLYNNSQIFPY